jgi:hypothetical protein
MSRAEFVATSRPGRATAALVTHLHLDHADPVAIAAALADGAPVFRPEPNQGSGDDLKLTERAEAQSCRGSQDRYHAAVGGAHRRSVSHHCRAVPGRPRSLVALIMRDCPLHIEPACFTLDPASTGWRNTGSGWWPPSGAQSSRQYAASPLLRAPIAETGGTCAASLAQSALQVATKGAPHTALISEE